MLSPVIIASDAKSDSGSDNRLYHNTDTQPSFVLHGRSAAHGPTDATCPIDSLKRSRRFCERWRNQSQCRRRGDSPPLATNTHTHTRTHTHTPCNPAHCLDIGHNWTYFTRWQRRASLSLVLTSLSSFISFFLFFPFPPFRIDTSSLSKGLHAMPELRFARQAVLQLPNEESHLTTDWSDALPCAQ